MRNTLMIWARERLSWTFNPTLMKAAFIGGVTGCMVAFMTDGVCDGDLQMSEMGLAACFGKCGRFYNEIKWLNNDLTKIFR